MKSKFAIYIGNIPCKLNVHTFSDGAIQCSIENIPKDAKTAFIEASILDSDGIMALAQIKNVLDFCVKDLQSSTLILSYLPYARYDRRMFDGDAFSLKVFGNMINALNFSSVQCDDVHGPIAAAALINNLVIRSDQTVLLRTANVKMDYHYIISPDNGAVKKAMLVSDHYRIPLLTATKKRDVTTGYTVFESLDADPINTLGKTCIIVDDICDGGATFVNLAENLKGTYGFEKVDLFVSHGIFSKGRDLQYIDEIFCYNELDKVL